MGIFLSYRRADSQDVVGRMYDRLISHFPIERVFRDLDSLRIGESFPEALADAVSNAKVALVVIGPNWATVRDSEGDLRLNNPADFVRVEVEKALAAGIPVVPILVTHATMPKEAELPPTLRPLVTRHAAPVRPDPDFGPDMERLIGNLARLLEYKDHNTDQPFSSEEAQRRVWNALSNVRAFIRHELLRRLLNGGAVEPKEWVPIHKASDVIAELSLSLPARVFAEAKAAMVDCLQVRINELMDLLRQALQEQRRPGFEASKWIARVQGEVQKIDEEFEKRMHLIRNLIQSADRGPNG